MYVMMLNYHLSSGLGTATTSSFHATELCYFAAVFSATYAVFSATFTTRLLVHPCDKNLVINAYAFLFLVPARSKPPPHPPTHPDPALHPLCLHLSPQGAIITTHQAVTFQRQERTLLFQESHLEALQVIFKPFYFHSGPTPRSDCVRTASVCVHSIAASRLFALVFPQVLSVCGHICWSRHVCHASIPFDVGNSFNPAHNPNGIPWQVLPSRPLSAPLVVIIFSNEINLPACSCG
jgi:hypothetical protein